MSNLRLYTSNRLENLAESLADRVRQPLESPFAPEIIVVQSQGMARGLKLQLAQRHGVCSNFQFPFPRAFSYQVFRAALPSLPKEAGYEPEDLVWRIMGLLPSFLDQSGFEALKNYLGGENDARKLFQLAQRI